MGYTRSELSSFYRWGKQGMERLNNLSKVIYLKDDRAVVWAQSPLLNQNATLSILKNTSIYTGGKERATEGFKRKTDSIWVFWVQEQPRIVFEEEDP